MDKQTISPEESLRIITGMIGKAKSNFAHGGSFYFLLWGSIIALADFGHFGLMKFTDYQHPYIVWLMVIPAVIITVAYSIKKRKRMAVPSSFDRIYGKLWWSIFICILIILAFMSDLSYQTTPVILLFSAVGTYVTGEVLRFRPLILGGVALALMAIVAFSVPLEYQYLIAGIGMCLGYIVPGIMLKKGE